MQPFDRARERLEKQYEHVVYDVSTGLGKEELAARYARHCAENPEEPRVLQRAYLINLIFTEAPVAPERENVFAGKICDFGLLNEDRWSRTKQVCEREFGLGRGSGHTDPVRGFHCQIDFSHKAPDWERVLELGIPGLRARVAGKEDPFYRASALILDGLAALCRRFDNDTLSALAGRAPATLREAFQLAYLFHDLVELCGEEVRTMGRFDRLYIDFYRRDLAAGRLTRDEAKELIKYFWIAFYARHQGKRFGKNFCFGPKFNELSDLGFEAWYEMNIVDPKLSVLLDEEGLQSDFLRYAARCVRDGRTSVVFLNDRMIVDSLIRCGRAPKDAENYLPIGCYEPAAAGEIAISGATHLRLPAFVLLALDRGIDYPTFRGFFNAYLKELAEGAMAMAREQSRYEKIWPEACPSTLISFTYDDCVANGRDLTLGGARYNSTGCVVSHFADAVDSLAAIEQLVYLDRSCTLAEVRQALAADWQGFEALRQQAIARAPKWGNNDERADRVGLEIANFTAPLLSALDNGRGGKIFPALFGQLVTETGKQYGAFPNGRRAGEPVAKNMDSCIAMDRNGVTALMNSVLKIDMAQYPNGTCLDLMLHPSAVRGEEGIEALLSVIRTFTSAGGSGLQFNIFDAETLREARKHPEKYGNLQVRVCGWNVRFTDLTPEAQQTFIDQAEALA